MERISWSLLTIVAVVMVTLLWKRWYMRSESMELPPGPRKLPIIGNLHQLNNGGELLHVTLAKLAKVHGKMMTVWFGYRQPSIVVSDYVVAWEVLVTKSSDFSSRTLPSTSKITTVNWQTLSTSNAGPFWHTLKKGLQSSTLNPNTISTQVKLQEEDIKRLMFSLQEEARFNDGTVKPLVHFRRTTVHLIGRFCFGPEFKDDVFVKEMDSAVEDTICLSSHGRLIDIFEFTKYLPSLKLHFQALYRLKQRIVELIMPYISQHKSTMSPCSTCYLHFLLTQDFSEEIIIFILFELFLLAVDSTSTAIEWAIAFLIHDQSIQQKLYKEVSGVRQDTITVEDVGKLAYVHAIVKETMRMKPIAPLAIPHRAVRNSELMGIKIAKGTPVFVNLYAMHSDSNLWVEPHRFMPERFLVDLNQGGANHGIAMDKMEMCFLPFGAGRRICAGMDLAKIQVSLCLANLVKKFQWSPVVEDQLPDLTEELTFVLRMKTPLVALIVPHC